MNKVILIGRLTKDPIPGNNNCKFTVAVNRFKKGEADFIQCTAFGKTAEVITGYMQKGSQIALEGRIQTGSYEKNGQKIFTTDVIVDRMEFIGGGQQSRAEEPTEMPTLDDHLKAQIGDGLEIVDNGDIPF